METRSLLCVHKAKCLSAAQCEWMQIWRVPVFSRCQWLEVSEVWDEREPVAEPHRWSGVLRKMVLWWKRRQRPRSGSLQRDQPSSSSQTGHHHTRWSRYGTHAELHAHSFISRTQSCRKSYMLILLLLLMIFSLTTVDVFISDVYSFEEEEAVLDPLISEHLSHFGIDMLQMQSRVSCSCPKRTNGNSHCQHVEFNV